MKRISIILLLLIFTFSYTYEAFALSDDTLPGAPAEDPVKPPAVALSSPQVTSTVVPEGIRLTWTQVPGADGYYVFYKSKEDEQWKKYSTKKSATSLKSLFKSAKSDSTFYFQIEAFSNSGGSSKSNVISDHWVKPMSLSSTLRQSTSLTVLWDQHESADGFQLECAGNRFFTDPNTVNLDSPEITEYQFKNLSGKSQYYARCRAYVIGEDGAVKYSPWTYSDNTCATANAAVKQLKYNGKTFEIREAAKQSVGYYDTLQGGCRTKDYGYFVLYNRNKEKCKIAKFNLNTGKRTKISKVLPISHGNDLTHNPDKGVLIAVHSTGNGRKVSVISPISLKVLSTKTISLNKPVPGLTESRRAAFKGIGAIAYNAEHKQYVARIKTLNDLLFLDSNLDPVRYVQLDKKDKQLYQGMDTAGDYVLVGQSFKDDKPYNIISVYDWNGNYISKVNIKKGHELECLFHTGNKFFAAFYTSYYQTYYKTAYKTVKVKNKKGKYVKKIVKYKKKMKRLMRSNYIYSMDKI